jgi:putative SOS response-associated peptidase YedK
MRPTQIMSGCANHWPVGKESYCKSDKKETLTSINDFCGRYHDRMAVIIDRADFDTWLKSDLDAAGLASFRAEDASAQASARRASPVEMHFSNFPWNETAGSRV